MAYLFSFQLFQLPNPTFPGGPRHPESCSVPRGTKGALRAAPVPSATPASPPPASPSHTSHPPALTPCHCSLPPTTKTPKSASSCSFLPQFALAAISSGSSYEITPTILDLMMQGSFYPLSARADVLIQPRHSIQLTAHLPFPLRSPEVICQRTHR